MKILAPSFGKVIEVKTEGPGNSGKYYYHVSTFLGPTDNHDQFIPYDCVCRSNYYKKGEFNFAHMLSKSDKNERWETTFEADFGFFVVTQIAGLIARRIINQTVIGKAYKQGEIYGEILLGSRVDITFPVDNIDCLVKKGDILTGAVTVIATYQTAKSLAV